MTVWLNGNWVDEAQASVSVRDTGLLHAAGVFTTMRSGGGKVPALRRHLERLRQSCGALFIPLQYSDAQLGQAVERILLENQLSDARLRLTVTRGLARQDPVHGLHLTPTVFLTATALEPYPDEYYQRGMTVVLIDEQKLNPHDVQAGHKTLNYFSRLAALREASRRAAGEAIWFDIYNSVQSGCISNLFAVKNGILRTPPTSAESGKRTCVLPGITRGLILELAVEAGIKTQLEPIDVNGLLEADEVFLTNSIMRVMPACRIERKAIGDDLPGAITRKLSGALDKWIEGTLAS